MTEPLGTACVTHDNNEGRQEVNIDLEKGNWMTLLIVVAAIIILVIGGVAVILNNLTFETYLNDIEKFAIAVGLTAIGRGLKAGVVGLHRNN